MGGSFLHHMSQECVSSCLDLFSVPATSTQEERSTINSYQPISTITDTGPIEFFVTGSADEYMDLSESKLYLQVKIVKKDGTNLVVGTPVGPINLFLHSLINQVDVYLNEHQINPPNNTYPYRAYLETLLNFDNATKSTRFGTAMWYADRAGHMDAITADNGGFTQRKMLCSQSRTVDLLGRLHLDITQQNQYVLNNVNLRIKLTRSKPSFCLMSDTEDDDYLIRITHAALYVRKVKVASSTVLAHASLLQKHTAKYPLTRVELKHYAISQGISSINKDNIILGQLPVRVVFGLVSAEAFNGAYTKNPFHFKHYSTTYVALNIDNQQIPFKPLTIDFEHGRFARAYDALLTGLNMTGGNANNGLGLKEFGEGFTLYAFDLTPEGQASGEHFSLVKNGNLKLEMQFAKPLPDSVVLLMMMEYENMMEIDQSRNITFDYTN